MFYRKTRSQDPATTVGTQLLICGTLFAIFTPITFAVSVTPEFLLDLVYVSIFSGFAMFFLWSGMLRRERVGKVTALAFAVPAMTTLIETIETGVIPGLATLSGIGIIFLGIYISRFRENRETADASAGTTPAGSSLSQSKSGKSA